MTFASNRAVTVAAVLASVGACTMIDTGGLSAQSVAVEDASAAHPSAGADAVAPSNGGSDASDSTPANGGTNGGTDGDDAASSEAGSTRIVPLGDGGDGSFCAASNHFRCADFDEVALTASGFMIEEVGDGTLSLDENAA